MARQHQVAGDLLEGLEQLRKKNEASMSDVPLSHGVPDHCVSSQQRSEYKHYRDHSVHAG